jgi:hypothetical protein
MYTMKILAAEKDRGFSKYDKKWDTQMAAHLESYKKLCQVVVEFGSFLQVPLQLHVCIMRLKMFDL